MNINFKERKTFTISLQLYMKVIIFVVYFYRYENISNMENSFLISYLNYNWLPKNLMTVQGPFEKNAIVSPNTVLHYIDN